jgi:hypothetical protein
MRRIIMVLALIGFSASGCRVAHADCRVTKASYEALQTGMSVAQAESLIGCKGEEMASSDIGGIKTVMLQWMAGMAGMNAMFQNDSLMTKAQFGLK